MTPTPTRRRALAAALLFALSPLVASADDSGTVVGKNDWLYFQWERYDPSNQPLVDRFTDMLGRANKVFADNGVHVVFTITPLKLQVYPQHLPPNFGPAPGTEGRNARMVSTLRARGATVADQLPAFKAAAAEGGEPLFLRLDSHWTPTGALLAAQTIRATIDADAKAAALLSAIPETVYVASEAGHQPSMTTDLLPTLPAGATAPPAETVLRYDIQSSGGLDDLTGDSSLPQITVIGSSFTHPGTQYPDGVRVALQRNLLDISIPGRQGPFVGIENYVRDTAFQLHPPKLLLWEVPERDSVNPPDSPWRDAEFIRDPGEWLLDLATAVSRDCAASETTAVVSETNVPNGSERQAEGGIDYGPSSADSYVQIDFNRPLEATDYLWMDIAITGSGQVRSSATGSDGTTVEWTLNVPEDGTAMPLKSRIPAKAAGARSLRLYPGAGENFALAQPAVCRHSPDLVANLATGAR